MNKRAKYYLSLMFLNGFIFAIGMSLFEYNEGLEKMVFAFVFNFIFFGGTMAAVEYFDTLERLQNLGLTTFNAEEINNYFNQEFTVYKNPDQIKTILQNHNTKKQSITPIEDNLFEVVPRPKLLKSRRQYEVYLKQRSNYESSIKIITPPIDNFSLLKDQHLLNSVEELKSNLLA